MAHFRVLAVLALVSSPASAGPFPTLLDDNRFDPALALHVSALFNTGLATLGLVADPFIQAPVPVNLIGRVTRSPKLYNLYWDTDWDGHNPGAATRAQIDAFTLELARSPFFDQAAEYGIVGPARFIGSHQAVVLEPCLPWGAGPLTEFIEVLHWVSCEVWFNPFNPLFLPPIFPAISGVPPPDDDTIYMAYLPTVTASIEGTCPPNAYHFFGAVPALAGGPFPSFRAQTVVFGAVFTSCSAPPSLDVIGRTASHEFIEAATDPIVGLGWINNTIAGDPLSDGLAYFNNVALDLRAGENADICAPVATAPPGAPAWPNPTPPVNIVATDPALGQAHISTMTWWSNARATCFPVVPVSILTVGTPQYTNPAGRLFVTSDTVFSITATDGGLGPGVASISHRAYLATSTPPAFTVTPGSSVLFTLPPMGDGRYLVEYFATGVGGVFEALQTLNVVLDDTGPSVRIDSPMARDYLQTETLTLDYTFDDFGGSGVGVTDVRFDALDTLGGTPLTDGRVIDLLTEVLLGEHSFTASAADNLGNRDVGAGVAFFVIATAGTLGDAVGRFAGTGDICRDALARALQFQIDAAESQRAAGNCAAHQAIYQAFISLVLSQIGRCIDPDAALILLRTALYLSTRCP